jgi:hypothetical protein
MVDSSLFAIVEEIGKKLSVGERTFLHQLDHHAVGGATIDGETTNFSRIAVDAGKGITNSVRECFRIGILDLLRFERESTSAAVQSGDEEMSFGVRIGAAIHGEVNCELLGDYRADMFNKVLFLDLKVFVEVAMRIIKKLGNFREGIMLQTVLA